MVTVVKRKSRPELEPAGMDEERRLEGASVRIVSVCEVYRCESAKDVEQGQKLLGAIKSMEDEVERHHRPIIEKFHEGHKLALAALKKFKAPLSDAKTRVKWQIDAFIKRERAKAAEAARIEQERLAKIAREQARIEAEQRAAAEKARLEAEAANRPASPFIDPTPIEVPVVIPEVVHVPAVQVEAPDFKAMGARTRRSWAWELESIRELCRGVAEGTVPAEFVQPNTVLINTLVRQQKADFTCRGIRTFEKEEVV